MWNGPTTLMLPSAQIKIVSLRKYYSEGGGGRNLPKPSLLCAMLKNKLFS